MNVENLDFILFILVLNGSIFFGIYLILLLGLVYKAVVGTSASSGQSVFTQAMVPIFGSWKDVLWLMNSLLGDSQA